jgi:16S rRNA (cytosine1402-N4)-methyltransferase
MPHDDDRGHVPVLRDAVLRVIDPQAGWLLVDGTVGAGGHAEAWLMAAPGTRVVAIDRDPAALHVARTRLAPFGDRVRFVHGNHRDLLDHLSALRTDAADAVLLDLGMSSLQLDDPQRGFSFRHEGPLDMRMDPRSGEPAATLVNEAPAEELVALLRRYGEERFAERIVGAICGRRGPAPFVTTTDLADVVRAAIPRRFHRPGFDPATKTFQALRIAVNAELEDLESVLPSAWTALREGGILAVISFHSLEDRCVKRYLRQRADPCVCPTGLPECLCGRHPDAEILTPRPIRPTPQEIEHNPRARSARLRAARKLP